ncbi:MAG: Na+:solute symporter [Prevotella sp.]|jgi:SSS family transporter|nr:Na+:solute symporter [Prevotella sp.]
MSLLDYIAIIIFTAGVLVAGLSFSKAGKSMKSFFAAGGNVPWWIVGLSLFMGFFSAGTFVVWGSIAYTHGLVAVTIQGCMCIAGFLVAVFIASRWKRTRVFTAAEYITNRLGNGVQKAYTYLFLLISLFTMGSFLYPVAKIVEVSTGLPLQTAILLLGGVSILYVTVGGLWAVVVTDVLQFVILMAAVLIVVPLSFEKIGGMDNFLQHAPEDFFRVFNGEYTLFFIAAFCIYNFVFLGGQWSYVQRYTSVRTEKDARKVGMLFASLYLICPVLWMLPPMIYRIYNGDLTGLADEGAYLLMCKAVLPKGILGLMIGGMVFATASSLNGSLNISAGVFTNDIFKRLFPHSTDKSLMKAARFSTIGFGLLAIVVALLIPLMGGIVNVVISIAALTGAPLYLPVVWTLFSRRQNKYTVLFTTLFSLTVNALFKFVTPLFGLSLDRATEMMTGVLVPIAVLSLIELYFIIRKKEDPQAAVCERMIQERIDRQQQEEENSPKAITDDNRASLKVIGLGVCLSGALILLLGALSEGFSRAVVCGVAAALVLLGAWIYVKSKK